jgi:hypothetical protein
MSIGLFVHSFNQSNYLIIRSFRYCAILSSANDAMFRIKYRFLWTRNDAQIFPQGGGTEGGRHTTRRLNVACTKPIKRDLSGGYLRNARRTERSS